MGSKSVGGLLPRAASPNSTVSVPSSCVVMTYPVPGRNVPDEPAVSRNASS
jgi:hypothetical protein